MAFNDTKSSFEQEHFTIIEIDLPIVEGACTIGGSLGYGTPLTCDQPSNATKTYRFTNSNAPILPVSEVYRCIDGITENTAELRSGRGLSFSATLNIKFNDFVGDPNPLAPAVNADVANQGTFFAKLAARNVLQNKPLRIINYRVADGQMPNLDSDGEVRYYIVDKITSDGRGKWTVTGKDELSRIEYGDKEWPEPNNGYLRQALGDQFGDTTLEVDPDTQYQIGDYIRINNEVMLIEGVSNIGTSLAELTVRGRVDRGIVFGSSTRTRVEEHAAGDEIFVCRNYADAKISEVLRDILVDSGIENTFIPYSDWEEEIDIWHTDTRVNYIFVEPEKASKQLGLMLSSYMIDMWFDPIARLVRILTVSSWRQSSATLTEGKEINYESVRIQQEEDLRATDSIVVYDKLYKTENDDVENYSKAESYTNPTLSSDDFYGEVKLKRFDNNPVIDTDAAQLLTRRYVSRYGTLPVSYRFDTEESKLNFDVGDVVDIATFFDVGFDGLPSSSRRAQVVQIKPTYNKVGRQYKVKALTYDPSVTLGGGTTPDGEAVFILTGNYTNLNLYNEAGGAIPEAVDVTFILDAVKVGSNSTLIPAMRAGNFPDGSKLTIICINGTDLQTKAGNGGKGGDVISFDGQPFIRPPTSGTDGGTVYDADGVDTDIYLSGATGNVTYPEANGFLRASGGGGDGGPATTNKTGSGGGGGSGRGAGVGGIKGNDIDNLGLLLGVDGQNGTETGVGGDGFVKGGGWGQDASSGGKAGKGIVKSGATVNIFGGTSSRFINGRGE